MAADFAQPSSAPSPAPKTDSKEVFRRLKLASFVGLVGQILLWGSGIALWVFGSVYANIPASTRVLYGAHGILVSAGAMFAVNGVLVAGALVSLLSVFLTGRSFQRLAKAGPPLNVGAEISLATIGVIGFAMFALGWIVWLGSFVAPGSPASGGALEYAPVLDPNLAAAVDGLLFLGGVFAFLGMLGIALASSKISITYEEGAIELGGALSMLPLLSVVGYIIALIGFIRGERKLRGGWSPPPPPPPPVYAPANYPVAYPGGPLMIVSNRHESWDGLAVALVVVLVLVWLFVLPIAFLSSLEPARGPGVAPGGSGNVTAPASSSAISSPVVPLLLVGLVTTGILLPFAIVRNRRKRERQSTRSVPAPPPPPPPPPPKERSEDPLNHLV